MQGPSACSYTYEFIIPLRQIFYNVFITRLFGSLVVQNIFSFTHQHHFFPPQDVALKVPIIGYLSSVFIQNGNSQAVLQIW